ncbi:MAG: hypothetical protein IMY76_01230 [Chloroflexi bacterium]|nr:hypothetical protein [Chloroflexota bacterium]
MEKEKMLGLMRYWLFGTFVIVFVAVAIYTGGAVGLGLAIFGQTRFWLAMAITAVLCVVWYYIYRGYLNNKE